MKRILQIIGLVGLLFLAGCGGQTDPATNITSSSATLHGKASCTANESGSYWWRYRAGTSGAWTETTHTPYNCPTARTDVPISQTISGLIPSTHYQFELCDHLSTLPVGVNTCANADGKGDNASRELPPPIDAFTTLAAPTTLRPVDGGPNYYAQFQNPLPSDPSFFPISVWGAYNFTAENVAKDKNVGLNTYVWNADTAAWGQTNIANAGMYTFQNVTDTSNIGAHTRGWLLDDEADMQQGPGNDTTNCTGPHPQTGAYSGYQRMRDKLALVPDNRATYANYGKGLVGPQWETDAQASCFVNAFQDITSADLYWHTDPNERSRPQSGTSWGYGQTVDRMRYLDGLDGVRQPIWNVVEVTWPWGEQPGTGGLDKPTVAEIRGAVWHSIIAGARGILYFQHSFTGPCTTHHALRETGTACYGAVIDGVRALNQQITQLAPVLNAPFEDSFAQAPSSVRAMTKNLNGQRYVFAGSMGSASSPTLTVAGGSKATVLFENRSIPITSGQFSDTFADGNAIHIYRID